MMNQTEAELETFRQKWREEVSAKTRGNPHARAPAKAPAKTQASSSRAPLPEGNAPEIFSHVGQHSEELDEVQPYVHNDLGEKQRGRRLDEPTALLSNKEPQSALEHYERAVEKESEGSLGDSLNLYRRAFKLDSKVHEQYKAKHFPPSSFKPKTASLSQQIKPQDPNPPNSTATVPHNAHHPLHGFSQSLQSMLNEFSALSIIGDDPPTELSPPPPCPIASLPDELLVEILQHVATKDVAAYVRLAQVCKRLAYLVITEERVWKRLATGYEFGFAAMHYGFACRVDGKPLNDDGEGGRMLGQSDDWHDLEHEEDQTVSSPSSASLTASLVPTPYPSYHNLFRKRPRIRFNGCYISTVNYTRPGASSPTSVTWNSPIHIVTYYRYLRFLRNGTCISLLTTSEPADVVPYLSLEHMHKNHGALPSAPMKDAVVGRWRLSGPEAGEKAEKEGTLLVETAGATPKYLYKLVLGLKSAGRAASNNKLAWQGYWSYNLLTDDWSEFQLRNDKPFYWSRVKSYGLGFDENDGLK